MSNFENKLKTFIEGCNNLLLENYNSMDFPVELRDTVVSAGGRKYIKLATSRDGAMRSAFCFVNKENGDVLKSASWKAPAKGARGNIYDSSNGLSRMSSYGAGYNR